MSYFRIPAIFLIVALSAGCFSKKPEGKVLARFGDQSITDKDFIQKAESLPANIRPAVFERKEEFLQDLVGEKILLKEALSRKLDQDKEVSDLIQKARNKILVAKLIQTEVDKKIKVDEDEARRFYDLNRDEFLTPLMLRASHILVKTKDAAEAIQSELSAGADFEETARSKSVDTTAIRGGDLGFFQKGQFVPEFEEAVFNMKKGEVKGPVQSQFGFHIIKLTDRVEPVQREFEKVGPRIMERLAQEKRSAAFNDYLKKIKGNTKVDIDQKALEALVPSAEKGGS